MIIINRLIQQIGINYSIKISMHGLKENKQNITKTLYNLQQEQCQFFK